MTERYRRARGAVHRDLVDTVVVLPPGAAAPVLLAGAATLVWDAAVEPIDADGLAADLADALGAGAPDAAAVLADLAAAGVLEVVG